MPNEFEEIREEPIPVVLRAIVGMLHTITRELRELREEVRIMSSSIVTRAQFDAALTALLAAEAARDAAVTQALNDLLAKIAAGTVTTPEDFTAELTQVTTLQSNAAALTQTATADDPGPTTVSPTPAAPSTPAAGS